VPKLVGHTLRSSRRALVSGNCRLGTVKHAFSRVRKKGQVISQHPKAGVRLRAGGRVHVVVSLGKAKTHAR
jgi:beta-lactam-binding protein with PASTA domain